ncbi:MAG: hypothetical protein K0R71_1923 [Bacillales bacterium]|jgi:hypothetical protein|nr:hypothetical protein [Bacillales bacterium]
MKKKRIIVIVVIAILLGLGYLKFFTMLLDNKENATIVKRDWGPIATDLKKDVSEADKIFIAEVYENLGTEKYRDTVYSLYKVRVTTNIMGRILDDPIVAIPGGYFKMGWDLKYLQYNDQPQLKLHQMYRFIIRENESMDWLFVTPNIGAYPLNNEKQKWENLEEIHEYLGNPKTE